MYCYIDVNGYKLKASNSLMGIDLRLTVHQLGSEPLGRASLANTTSKRRSEDSEKIKKQIACMIDVKN